LAGEFVLLRRANIRDKAGFGVPGLAFVAARAWEIHGLRQESEVHIDKPSLETLFGPRAEFAILEVADYRREGLGA
jgi:hypothetical protein